MYYERLPAYEYDLPCGHTFRSLTRSTTYTPNGRHHFYCRRCETDHAIMEVDLMEHRPENGAGRLSDNQLAIRVDSAIQADRVAAFYRVHWDSVPFWTVCRTLGIHDRIVRRVAAELGVYEDEAGLASSGAQRPSERRLRASERVSAGD